MIVTTGTQNDSNKKIDSTTHVTDIATKPIFWVIFLPPPQKKRHYYHPCMRVIIV